MSGEYEKARAALLSGVTVGKLREMLAEYDDDMPVIVLGEHGQGGETPAYEVAEIWYEPLSTWSGEAHSVADPEYTPGERDVRCVFIVGVN